MLKKMIALSFLFLMGCSLNVAKKERSSLVDIKVVSIEKKANSFDINIAINNQTDSGVLIYKGESVEKDGEPGLMVGFKSEELKVYFNDFSCIAPEVPPYSHFLFIPAKKSISFQYNLERKVDLSLGGKTIYCSVEKEENLSVKKLKMVFQLFSSDNYKKVCGSAKECVKRLGILNLKKIPIEITVTKELPEALEVFYVPDPAERYLKE